VEIDRRKGHGNRSRGQQDLAKELAGFRMATGGDGAHVPHCHALSVQIRSADIQPAAFAMFGSNGVDLRLVELFLNQLLPWRTAGERVPISHNSKYAARLEYVLVLDLDVTFFQFDIGSRPEKGVRRNQ